MRFIQKLTGGKFAQAVRKICWLILLCLGRLSVAVFFIWSAGAIFYLHYLPLVVRVVVCTTYLLGGIWLIVRALRQRRTNGSWTLNRSVAVIAMSIPIVYLLTLLIRPANDRDWAPEQQQLPHLVIDSGNIKIENFRNNFYRSETDFDVRYETRKFKLDDIQEAWFIVQRFSAMEGLAHTFLSFGCPGNDASPAEYISVSVEIRREQGEAYSPWQGTFRNYELNYVVGDERDLIGVRTVHRPDDRVFLYKTNATPDQARTMFLDIATRINELREQPEFYNTFLNNCANGIVVHTRDITPEPVNWLEPRVILPGYSDSLVFDLGLIGDNSAETLEQLRTRSRIDVSARASGISESFSMDIRTSQ